MRFLRPGRSGSRDRILTGSFRAALLALAVLPDFTANLVNV